MISSGTVSSISHRCLRESDNNFCLSTLRRNKSFSKGAHWDLFESYASWRYGRVVIVCDNIDCTWVCAVLQGWLCLWASCCSPAVPRELCKCAVCSAACWNCKYRTPPPWNSSRRKGSIIKAPRCTPASISFSQIFTHARDNGRMRFRSLCFPLSPLFLIARLLHEIVRCQKIAGWRRQMVFRDVCKSF